MNQPESGKKSLNMQGHLTPEQYLQMRIDDQIQWYDRKSGILKRRYRAMKMAMIILGVLIPVAVALNPVFGEWANYTAAAFGAVIAGLESISGMLKDNDNYLAYRNTREALVREKMLFTTGTGPYADESKNAFTDFVTKCETIMASEQGNWLSLFNEKDAKSRPAGK